MSQGVAGPGCGHLLAAPHWVRSGGPIAGRTVAECLDVLGEAEALCNPVDAPVDRLADERAPATDAAPRLGRSGVGPVPVPRIPGLPDGALANRASGAPAIGEHGAEILSEFGYDTAAIAALRECGALGGPPPEA